MKKAIFLVIGLVVIFIVSFIFYRYYQISQVRNQLSPLVQNITLRTSNNVIFETEESKITYKELFEKIEKDLSEIDSKIIDLQTISASFN